MPRTIICSMAVAALFTLSACTEKPQTVTSRKADDKPWDSSVSGFKATGYQAGDRAAWEQQVKTRNQSQNEYNRTGSH